MEYFLFFELQKYVFFCCTGHRCWIFFGSQINDVFLSVLCLQRYFYCQSYSPGTSANTAFHYYHLVNNFRLMNCVLRGYFLGFHYSESTFPSFLSVAKYFFWVVQKYPTPLIPVCRNAKSTPWVSIKLIRIRFEAL